MERKKEVTLFHLGFLVCADGQRKSGTCLVFAWFLLAEVATATAQLGPQNPPTPGVVGGARPPDHFQDSAMTEARCDPVARTAFPGLPPTLLDLPLAPPAPSAHPSSQRESCQPGGGLECSGGGRPLQDGYDLGHGNTSASSSPWPSHCHRVYGRAAQG